MQNESKALTTEAGLKDFTVCLSGVPLMRVDIELTRSG